MAKWQPVRNILGLVGAILLGCGALANAQPLAGTSLVDVIDPDLDLPTQLALTAPEAGAPLVTPAPRLVVGQGEGSQNQTVVRVLNQYGITEQQFLAYPTAITCGVRVCAGRIFPPAVQIVTAPLTSTATREIRIFSEDGVLQTTIDPGLTMAAPYVIATGNFIDYSPGEEIAVAARDPQAGSVAILIYSGAGRLLRQLDPPLGPDRGAAGLRELSTVHAPGVDQLLITYMQARRSFVLEPMRQLTREVPLGWTSTDSVPYESVFSNDLLVGGGSEPLLSTLWRTDTTLSTTTLNVGQRENRFWVNPIAATPGANPIYTFDSGADGWWAGPYAGRLNDENDKLVFTYYDSNPFDPYFNAPAANFDGGQYYQFAMQVTVSGGPSQPFNCSVYWFPQVGGVGVSPFKLTNGIQTVRFNLATNKTGGSPAFTGMIAYIRLDIPDGAATLAAFKNTRVEVDWVAVTADPNYVPAQKAGIWTEYVREGRFRHLRVDASSPAYAKTDFDNTSPDYWLGAAFKNFITNSQGDYANGVPSVWEPTYTHRQFKGTFDNWYNTIDTTTSLPRFAALTRTNKAASYSEVGSDFLVSTWAPGVAPLERLFIWPLRAYLRDLAVKFRGAPDQMIALEPNHEFEIPDFAEGTIGDYHPAMIAGFQAHLLKLYTNLDKINNRFGTSFASLAAFDAPRDQGRGAWDAYNAANPFFNAWVQYLRKVILWRVSQALREALLAGFPPEIIKTHQIPADYAVGPPIGGRRITPIDWILSAGTGYGSTKYGVWYSDPSNFVQGAQSSGQSMISIGEYHPLTTNQSQATAQARYVFSHGVQFINHMTWNDPALDPVGRAAYTALAGDNQPRPGTVGGVGPVRAVRQPANGVNPAQSYNIVEVGTGPSRAGLLKNVNADGSWQGSVYVEPFHAAVTVTALNENETRTLAGAQYTSALVTGLNSGDQLEIKFRARTDNPGGKFTLLVLHNGIELPRLRRVIAAGAEWRFYHYVLRIQNPMDDVMILMNSGERDTATGYKQTISMEGFSVLTHREKIARKESGVNSGTPYGGGVTYDLLSRECVPTTSSLGALLPPYIRTGIPAAAWERYDAHP